MIRVLHLTSSFGSSAGAEANLLRLVLNMNRRVFQNSVVTMTGIAPASSRARVAIRLNERGIPLYSLGMRPGIPNPVGAMRLLRIIRRERPHIIQTWMYHADLLGLLCGKAARVPAIAWNILCTSVADYRFMSRMVVRMLVRLSPLPDVVLTNSIAGREFHNQIGYHPRKWVFIPNSVDLARFRPDRTAGPWLRSQLRLRSDSKLVGLIARFHPAKDHALFIRAAELLGADRPHVHFVLAGGGIEPNNANLARLITDTPIADRFHLLGRRHDVERLTAALDVACSSSLTEGSSNTIVEAMACGVPCVATNVGDASLMLGGVGRVVPSRDPQEFAHACAELLELNEFQRFELASISRKRVLEDCSLDSVVSQFERVYYQLARRSPQVADGTVLDRSVAAASPNDQAS